MVSSTCSAARRMASWSMSMAPSTALSASSEYGGRRSRNASGWGAIEYSTGELDIVPGWPLPGRVAQQRRGMVGDDHGDAVIAMDRAAQLADRELGVEERLRRERP